MNRSLEAMTLRVFFQRAARAEFDAAALAARRCSIPKTCTTARGWMETLDPFAVSPARRAARKTLQDHEAPRRRASLRFGARRQPSPAPALVGELKQWPESGQKQSFAA